LSHKSSHHIKNSTLIVVRKSIEKKKESLLKKKGQRKKIRLALQMRKVVEEPLGSPNMVSVIQHKMENTSNKFLINRYFFKKNHILLVNDIFLSKFPSQNLKFDLLIKSRNIYSIASCSGLETRDKKEIM
jgi:hypothetical protein